MASPKSNISGVDTASNGVSTPPFVDLRLVPSVNLRCSRKWLRPQRLPFTGPTRFHRRSQSQVNQRWSSESPGIESQEQVRVFYARLKYINIGLEGPEESRVREQRNLIGGASLKSTNGGVETTLEWNTRPGPLTGATRFRRRG